MITLILSRFRLASLSMVCATILALTATAQQRWEPLDRPEGAEITAFGQSGDVLLVGGKSQMFEPLIFRSLTGGASWVQANPYMSPHGAVTSFAVLGDTIYAGVWEGLYRSLDDGHSWEKVPGQNLFSPPTNIRVAALNGVLFGADGDSVYTITPQGTLKAIAKPWPAITSTHAVAMSNQAMFIGATAGFFRSTDRGVTWRAITLDPNAGHVISLAATGDTILALTHETGAFRSIDNGEHWEKISTTGLTVGSVSIMGTTAYLSDPYRHMIERSTDAGATWMPLRNGPAISAIHITPTAIFAATLDESGVLQSLDNGATWTVRDRGLFTLPGQALLPMDNDLLIGTLAGLFRLRGANDAMERITGPDEIRLLARLGDDIIYAGRHGFVRWSAQSKKWIDEKIESDRDTITSFATVGDALYIATRGTVYRATNTGAGLAYERTALEAVRIHSIASDGSTIVATNGKGIWRTTDRGQSWQKVAEESHFPFGTQIWRVTYRNGTFYALTSGGIYSSADGNLPWSSLSPDLDRIDVTALEYVDGALYAGAYGGVYRSLDNGRSWTKFNDGMMEGVTVQRLALVGKTLYAGLYHYPIHRIQAGTLSAPDESASSAAHLLELRPNPSAGRSIIAYTLTHGGKATITLFDPMGREVRTLFDGISEAGEHEMPLDAAGLPNGIYFLRLEAGGALTTRAVVIDR